MPEIKLRLPKICLKHIICRHHAKIPGGASKLVHIIVFMDPRDHETYIWIDNNNSGLDHNFQENHTYSIVARVGGGINLSDVHKINPSEQLDESGNLIKQNALDILLPDTHLTFDEKHDILTKERRER